MNGAAERIGRAVGTRDVPGGEGRCLSLSRTFDASPGEVWNACTDAGLLSGWLLPVEGDLRPGGTYRLAGGASGEVLACEPPARLRVSWHYAQDREFSEVELRLSSWPEGGTLAEIDHVFALDPELWDDFGPAAAGVGWDLVLHGLSLHLRGETLPEDGAWHGSPEAAEFKRAGCEAWGAALLASGATPVAAATATANSLGFYLGQ